jgi:hypothetical protein
MAKPYKLTPIELVLSPIEHFEDNLSKFINDENIADDKKLVLLQDALRHVDKHRPYRERPTTVVNVTDPHSPKQETSPQDSAAATAQSMEKELNSIVTSIGKLLPNTYREQSKKLLTYLILESGDDYQVQVDSTGKRIITQGKSYNVLNLVCDMVTNRKRLLSFDINLYSFLNTSNFPKSLIGNKQILKKIREYSRGVSPLTTSTTFKKEDKEEDFKSILENTSTPSSSSNDLTTPMMMARQKRRRIDINSLSYAPPSSVQKGSGHYTTCLRSKWMEF